MYQRSKDAEALSQQIPLRQIASMIIWLKWCYIRLVYRGMV